MYIYIEINSSRRWTPTPEMYLHKFTVWGRSLRGIYIVLRIKYFQVKYGISIKMGPREIIYQQNLDY